MPEREIERAINFGSICERYRDRTSFCRHLEWELTIEQRADRRYHGAGKVGLFHHVARIESGVHHVAAECCCVPPLVREEPHGGWLCGEDSPDCCREVNRLPPSIGRD